MRQRVSSSFVVAAVWLGVACGPAAAPPTVRVPTQALPLDTTRSHCGFPAKTKSQLGWVRLHVYVDANGDAQRVEVLQESERAFGDHAAQCAYRSSFRPATDASGKPIGSWTPELVVHFVL